VTYPADRNERSAGNGDNGVEGERVVVRDRRRIDPVTGEARPAVGAPAADGPAEPGRPAEGGPNPDPAPDAAGDGAAAELAAQLEERTTDLQRVSAEYANYRRRVDRDREAVLVGARVQFVGDLLTVLDDVERAEQHGDLTGPFKAVADKLTAVVQKLGLEAFGLEGEPFDPSVHEAVQHEASTASGPTVTVVSSVLRRGFRIADRVLRPAMVTVADRPEDGAPAAEPDDADGPSGKHRLAD
jgi:molecular chaperone GrpE